MRRTAKLVLIAMATLAIDLPAGAAESDCYGCGSRMIDDGYMCSSGEAVVHEGGFFMSGWYGYSGASHTEPMCGYCSRHRKCLWGAIEAAEAVQYAIAAGDALSGIHERHQKFIKLDAVNSKASIIGCDGEVVRMFDITLDQIEA